MPTDLIAGRYRMVRAVGKGGMGAVWLCHDELLGRDVAVKQAGTLPGESVPDSARAFREARSSAALNHRNVVSVFDIVEETGRIWLVMEYVPSRTLGEIITTEGALTPLRVAVIGAQIADGLAAAHAFGTIHRDVKPGNILVSEGDRAKIGDFGIARTAGDAELTSTGLVTGTPAYMAPELARGEDPGRAADVWALGATLYTAVEGTTPFPRQRNPIAMLETVASDLPARPRHAGDLTGPITRMMDRDPLTRWTMLEAAHALRRCARTLAGPSVPGALGGGALAVGTVGASTGRAGVGGRSSRGGPGGRGGSGAGFAASSPADPAPATSISAVGPAAALTSDTSTSDTSTSDTSTSDAGAAAASTASSDPATTALGAPASDDLPGPYDDNDPGSRGRRLLPLLLAIVLLVVMAGAGYALVFGDNDTDAPAAEAPMPTTSTPPSPSSPSSESADPGRKPSTTKPAPDAGRETQRRVVPPAVAKERFIRSYFSTVPGDTATGWTQLAPVMQAAGGRAGYESFWSTVSSVRTGRVTATAGDPVVRVSLIYTFHSGRVVAEDQLIRLQRSGGDYLIADDEVIRSRTLRG